jgi:UDP-GlcNAc:undecaprenyl-phosphate GlcNAc-1-phosphate transferase
MHWLQDFLPVISGFMATLFFVLLLNPLAKRLGWVDKPDNIRKLHEVAVPLTGGIAMMLAFSLSMFWIEGCFTGCRHSHLLEAMILMSVVGAWDDRNHIPTKLRMLIQTIVGYLLALAAGLSMRNFGNILGTGEIVLPDPLGLFFTVFCVVGAMNAINMIDGVDGLAGGVVISALWWLAFITYPDNLMASKELFVLVGCISCYLCFNMRGPWRKRASIFMGDAGSMMLGLALVWLLITLSQPSVTAPRALPPVVGLWLVAIPLLDTICLMINRRVNGKSPFRADRTHFHHTLQDAGLTPGETSFTIILITFVLGGMGVLGWKAGLSESILFASFLAFSPVFYYFVHHSRKLQGIIGEIYLHSPFRKNR